MLQPDGVCACSSMPGPGDKGSLPLLGCASAVTRAYVWSNGSRSGYGGFARGLCRRRPSAEHEGSLPLLGVASAMAAERAIDKLGVTVLARGVVGNAGVPWEFGLRVRWLTPPTPDSCVVGSGLRYRRPRRAENNEDVATAGCA